MRKNNQHSMRLCLVRIISYLIICGLNLLFFLFFRSYLYIMIGIILGVVLCLSVLAVVHLQKILQVKVITRNSWIGTGQTGQIDIVLRNPSWISSLRAEVAIVVENPFQERSENQRVILPVRIHGESRFQLPMKSSYNGLVRVRLRQVWIQDILGLFLLKVYPSNRQDVPGSAQESQGELFGEYLVFPDKDSAKSWDAGGFGKGMTENEESTARGSDYSQVSDIRDFIPGDRIKDIHWKLSAKKDHLMVKERVSISQNQLVLLLDLSGNGAQRDEVVSESYTFCQHILGENTGIRLMWWNEKGFAFQSENIYTEEDIRSAYERVYRTPVFHGTQKDLLGYMQNSESEIHSYILTGVVEEEVITQVMENDGN